MKKYIVPETSVTTIDCNLVIATSFLVQRGEQDTDYQPIEDDRTFGDDGFTGIWGE